MNSRNLSAIAQTLCLLSFASLLWLPTIQLFAAENKPLEIEIDARELPRKLLHSRLVIPVLHSNRPTQLALWYPKWVPGSHGPGGPIANVGGFSIKDHRGNPLHWSRSPGEAYRIEVEIPSKTTQITVDLTYITNQPTTNSMGHDSWGAKDIGVISPNTILVYPEDCNIRETKVTGRILLPHAWQAASALFLPTNQKDHSSTKHDQIIHEVTLEQFVDSPIMCGSNYTTVQLVESNNKDAIPPHQLHIFADASNTAPVAEDIVNRFRSMVVQTARMTGAHPFDRFDILLAATDQLPPNGLEHSKSTFNVLPTRSLSSADALRGWNRLLIPHEYLHAWCGKYRRPAGMVTANFHSPEDTELLWVYEGLTQYLGELVEARCGLMSEAQFRDRILVELRNATYQQGRKWRTLADTGAAAHLLRSSSNSWPELRRSQDFYMEGMLFWLEVDALLRTKSDGKYSLDDFCRVFFQIDNQLRHPKPYTRKDLVTILQRLLPYDWDGLIQRRIESYQNEFDPAVAGLLGYRLDYEDTPVDAPTDTFRAPSGTDFRSSLGAVFANDGDVVRVLRDSPAERAQLTAGMKVVAINSSRWSTTALREAVIQCKGGRPILVHVLDGDAFRSIQIHYYDGLRSLNLALIGKDLIPEIVQSR